MNKLTLTQESAAQLRPRRAFVRVTCFIDWNSQLLLTGIDYTEEPVVAARIAFQQTIKRVAQSLTKTDSSANFKVNLRLYHGWRKGYEPTTNFRAIRKVITEADFSTISESTRVTFSSDVGYGDRLLLALDRRMHRRDGIHLPNTLRDRGSMGQEEKMVDTALATDVVVSAYQDPGEWILLVAEDDDHVPPLFAAESILNAQTGKALLLSKRKRGNNFLLLKDLDVS